MRLIPAHAGKTARSRRGHGHCPAHPRSRGENGVFVLLDGAGPGSSPLTRGKLGFCPRTFAGGGLIPAHAGKTHSGSPPARQRRAHPRSRGENCGTRPGRLGGPGSSPLTRGKPAGAAPADRRWGLIPAHAGKTLLFYDFFPRILAHPRSRGENWEGCHASPRASGSSPLTRGKRSASHHGVSVYGLIPAHAGKTHSPTAYLPIFKAHPRSRGENNIMTVISGALTGSSPLTRGKPSADQPHYVGKGLIPAHAGKTAPLTSLMKPRAAHPRSRGENPRTRSRTARCGGSSPLTRGKHLATDTLPRDSGLIPAHAGKTAAMNTLACTYWAHPRSRGENTTGWFGSPIHPGSSPLTRGKRAVVALADHLVGLIPAHAGKTKGALRYARHTAAHPRSRGENVEFALLPSQLHGSSPLTRGKRHVDYFTCLCVGLIPAHAGKTLTPTSLGAFSAAHPRSRGENSSTPSCPCCLRGSSPLTRGKLTHAGLARRERGLIPAHAGKTCCRDLGNVSPTVHPRSRGENLVDAHVRRRYHGSSPLTRGKPGRVGVKLSSPGLIPAHAGKTLPVIEQVVVDEGSSPLTRGKRRAVRIASRAPGLIPAHAGKTRDWSYTVLRQEAHPRSRGENTS